MIKRLHLKRPAQLTDKSAVTKKIRRPAAFHPVDSIHAPIDSLTCQLSISVNFSSSAWFVRPLADENERPFGWRSSDFRPLFGQCPPVANRPTGSNMVPSCYTPCPLSNEPNQNAIRWKTEPQSRPQERVSCALIRHAQSLTLSHSAS